MFTNVHLKMTWNQHHILLKFMELLLDKGNNKDDVFFVSYTPP